MYNTFYRYEILTMFVIPQVIMKIKKNSIKAHAT